MQNVSDVDRAPVGGDMSNPGESADTLEGQMRLWWFKACQWEGVSPQSSFVVFSSENPHQAAYYQAFETYRGPRESLKKPKKGA